MSDLRVCTACGRVQTYPMPVCRGCGGGEFAACALPFKAVVYSHTTVARAPTAALQERAPYSAVLVRAAQGGLLLLPFRGDAAPEVDATVMVRESEGQLLAESAPGGAN